MAAAFSDVLSKGRFADLSRAKQDNTRLGVQGLFDPMSMTTLDHILHLFYEMADLQG